MSRQLCEESSEARKTFEEAQEVLGYNLAKLCVEGPATQLNLTEFAQPALVATSLAYLRVLKAAGLTVVAVAGHSVGEYAAVVAAGGLSFRETISLVRKRGQYMQEAVPPGVGLVIAVLGLPRAEVEAVCLEAGRNGTVAPVNFNAPGQIVVAGEKSAVETAGQLVRGRGGKAVVLPISVPVHCALMAQAAAKMAIALDAALLSPLEVPLVANMTAQFVTEPEEVRAGLKGQLDHPVLWEDSIRAILARGAEVFIEVGPGRILTGLMKRIAPEATAVALDAPGALERLAQWS